jgi:hypothetical protein
MPTAVPVVLGNGVLSNGSLAVLAGNFYGNATYYGSDQLHVAIHPNSTPVKLNQSTGLSFPAGESSNGNTNDSGVAGPGGGNTPEAVARLHPCDVMQ